ncbi:MAG TPA: hypothetical protein VHP34_11130, partial [Alphaproteobacteria bacterium]|nr:hypothetical protein [Alphaproteobacteria bacterium]
MNKKTFSFKVCFAAGFISTATVNVSPSQAWTVPEKPLVNSALVFDLDDNGIETAALNAKGSVYFDWDGDDFAEATAWLNTKDGF